MSPIEAQTEREPDTKGVKRVPRAALHDPLILTMQGFGQHEPLIRLDLHRVSWFLSPACLSHAGVAISLHAHLFTSPAAQGLTPNDIPGPIFPPTGG